MLLCYYLYYQVTDTNPIYATSKHSTLLLASYFVKPILTHWIPYLEKMCHYFYTGVYWEMFSMILLRMRQYCASLPTIIVDQDRWQIIVLLGDRELLGSNNRTPHHINIPPTPTPPPLR